MESLKLIEMCEYINGEAILLASLMLILTFVLLLFTIKTNEKLDKQILVTLIIVCTIGFCGSGIVFHKAIEDSGKMMYKITVDNETDIQALYDEYDIIDSSSNTWIVREKTK